MENKEVEVALVARRLMNVEVAVEVAVRVPTVNVPIEDVAEIVPARN